MGEFGASRKPWLTIIIGAAAARCRVETRRVRLGIGTGEEREKSRRLKHWPGEV